MSKIGLIIRREYVTRVKKKSFIVMTILGPLLFAGFFAAVLLLSKQEKENYTIAVLDDTYVLSERMPPMSEKFTWESLDKLTYQEAIIKFKTDKSYEKYDYLLWLPPTLIKTYKGVGKIIYRKVPSLVTEGKIKESVRLARESFILSTKFEGDSAKLKAFRKEYEDIRSLSEFTLINLDNVNDKGEKIDEDVNYKVGAGVGLGLSFTTFFFIFFFGAHVMRGVIEEKTNRIIEIIISSVKPFELMMGKIVGVGLVGLTQFLIWGVLSSILFGVVTSIFAPNTGDATNIAQMSQEMLSKNAENIQAQNEVLNSIFGLPWLNIISAFIFFFLMGYLIYSALFAAIGSAVDNEADTQQFMTPVILPLLLAFYVVAFSAFENPDSAAMYWLSLFPLTSPVVMLVRIAMGSAALWEVILSMFLLVITFVGTVWVAAKIYRTGILMYGKKPSYKEIFKWLKY